MSKPGHDLPLRSDNQIDARPMIIEEWLDALPYVDFKRTATLIEAATRAVNQQQIKPSTRLELVELFNRPYQYYIESQVRAGAHHTLQSMETVQAQIAMLKRVAVNLGMAAKLAADDFPKQKSLWKAAKPPLPASLWSLHYLSHALIFSFLEYAPTPSGVWSELHRIYRFAESLQKEYDTIALPGAGARTPGTSISDSYLRIVMAALADPNHLPFGAIWEIYEQLRTWTKYVNLGPPVDGQVAGGSFVIDLEGDSRPVPLKKFAGKMNPARHRLVDGAELGGVIEDLLERLDSGAEPDAGLRMSPYFARTVLRHMLRTWGLPPERTHAREPRRGAVNMVCGLAAVYFHINGGREPERTVDAEDDDGDMTHDAGSSGTRVPVYVVETWNLVDQAPGGIAVISTDRPGQAVRVGDLIGIATGARDSATANWSIGVIRWLMIKGGRQYRLGVQLYPGRPAAVDVRATTGSKQDRNFRRALLLPAVQGRQQTIIAERGLFAPRRALEARTANGVLNVIAEALIEGAVTFEQVGIAPA